MRRLAVRVPVLAALAIVTVVAVVAAAAAVTGRALLREQAVAGVSRLLDGYLSGVRGYLEQAETSLELTSAHLGRGHGLAGRRGRAGKDAAAVADSALRTSDVFEYLMVVGHDGRAHLVRPAAAAQAATGTSFAGRTWLREARRGRLAVSDLEIAPATRRPSVVMAVPVRDRHGVVRAVLAGGVRLAHLSAMGARPGSPETRARHGFIADRRGLVVAHQGYPDYVKAQTDFSAVPPVRQALAGQRGASFGLHNPVEGRSKVSAYAPLPNVGWAVVFGHPAADALAPAAAMTRRMLVAGAAVAALFSVLLAGYVARALRPLTLLKAAAAKLGAGDLDTRIRTASRDEVGELAAEFNRMADGLAASHGALEERAGELEAAVAQLEEAVRTRDATVAELDAFAYSVSHDLRAPLRAIDGFSAAVVAEAGDSLDPHSRADLERVRRAAGRMGELIDDLLGLARITRRRPEPERVDVSALAIEVAMELATANPERDGRIEVADGMSATADPRLLRIVLEQLIGNAWKFTEGRRDAHIEVGANGSPGMRRIFVRDNGAGFEPEFAHKLFTPFQRLHSESEFEGTGIGLATVRRIVTRHGGAVAAEGRPGEGATFSFTLPDGASS